LNWGPTDYDFGGLRFSIWVYSFWSKLIPCFFSDLCFLLIPHDCCAYSDLAYRPLTRWRCQEIAQCPKAASQNAQLTLSPVHPARIARFFGMSRSQVSASPRFPHTPYSACARYKGVRKRPLGDFGNPRSGRLNSTRPPRPASRLHSLRRRSSEEPQVVRVAPRLASSGYAPRPRQDGRSPAQAGHARGPGWRSQPLREPLAAIVHPS
jgi:hypothetical protein